MSPIEVMARAICRTVLAGLVASDRLDAVVNEEWHGHVLEATAALLALSKMLPTAEMLSAAYEANDYQNDDMDNILIWEAMLNAAVKESEGEK